VTDPNREKKKLKAKQEASDAWANLPEGSPSKDALPPAGGGLGSFFGMFFGRHAPRWLWGLLIAIVLLALIYTALR